MNKRRGRQYGVPSEIPLYNIDMSDNQLVKVVLVQIVGHSVRLETGNQASRSRMAVCRETSEMLM